MDRGAWQAAVHAITRVGHDRATKERGRVKAIVFPVVMCGCESWSIKKAEQPRIDAFELWCWRRLFQVLWTARRSHQSILKEIRPECFIGRTDVEAETPILWPPDAQNSITGKDLMLGKI